MSMKKEDVLRQLDQIVTTHKAYLAAMERLDGNKIFFCKDSYIQVFTGIQYLAEAAGEKIHAAAFSSDKLPYEHSFTYRETEIFQLDARKNLPEVQWDED